MIINTETLDSKRLRECNFNLNTSKFNFKHKGSVMINNKKYTFVLI